MHRKTLGSILLGCAIAASAACNRSQSAAEERRDQTISAATPNDVAADNTKRNERDRNNAALTPGDQGSSEADRNITQQVRQSVIKDDSLSMTAKNSKIITQNGVVTLRGPVKNMDEKAALARIAQNTAGVSRVDNQLEIAPE